MACACQVEPPATAEDNACGTSWLWWIQRIKPTDGVWDIARNAWESIRSESNFKNGLTFWVRLLGHRFAHEVFSPEALDKPFTPPFTVCELPLCSPCMCLCRAEWVCNA